MGRLQSILIVSHRGETNVPTGPLLEYTKKNFKQVDMIFHPLWGYPNIPSSCSRYVNGSLNDERYFSSYVTRFNMLISYFGSLLLTVLWVVKSRKRYQLFIGVNNLNAMAGLVLKRLGVVERVVFYTADYARRRYDNQLANSLYHWVDRVSVTGSDLVWNVSQRICQVRREQGVTAQRNIHVPNGVHFDRTQLSNPDVFSRKNLVFVGHLIPSKGIDSAIRAVSDLVQNDQEIILFIIGTGSYEYQLKELVARERLGDNVKFLGYLSNEDVLHFLSTCGVGLAFYTREDEFNIYCDPVKVKEYLACGCPVIITDVPEIGSQVEQMQMGKVIHDPAELAGAIKALVEDDLIYCRYRENAHAFARDFDWDDIYNRAFTRMGY